LVRLMKGSFATPADIAGQRCVIVPRNAPGAAVFGPYEDRPAGRYRVTFQVALADDERPVGDPVACIIDVQTNSGTTLFAERHILYSQLAGEFASFSLEIRLQEPRPLEYRVISSGPVALAISDEVDVSPISEVSRPIDASPEQRRVWQNESEFLDGYLRNVTGLIHVGANIGQERLYYWLLGLDVAWVEPIREVYERLIDNISKYPRQFGINALISRRDGEEVAFKIANNFGASSSLLDFEEHSVIWPEVGYVEERKIVTSTLTSIMREHGISTDLYQALTLDVQGAEKMILEGARDVLDQFKYVKCEVADFPAYAGTPTVVELDEILTQAGFAELSRRAFAGGPDNRGTYWDIVWKKVVAGEPLHNPAVPLPMVMNPDEVMTVEKCE
jgi:FkbM family methyltransferase